MLQKEIKQRRVSEEEVTISNRGYKEGLTERLTSEQRLKDVRSEPSGQQGEIL